jgi:hypothetical protein
MTNVKIGTYGNYSSENYGAHAMSLSVGNLTLYFSYKTVVAFQDGYNPLVIIKNQWGPTTGKHLNAIDPDKNIRVSSVEFEEKLNAVLKAHNLTV